MAWKRKSASAWLCGESLGAPVGFCGEVCVGACASRGADAGVAGRISRRGSTAAVAALSAARRANSRREQGLSVGGMVVTHQREVDGHTEATESRARGQLGHGIGDRLERNCPFCTILVQLEKINRIAELGFLFLFLKCFFLNHPILRNFGARGRSRFDYAAMTCVKMR